MLEHTALPVSVVAKRSGWKSIPTFGRDFYAAMGVSPTECRKMFCAK
jgi:transcriptional regulator GlxA family with amidase domain